MTAPASPPVPASRVTLITRASCQLCAPARAIVERVCSAEGRRWSEVRIDDDPELRAEFGDRIPVVLVDGLEIASLAIDEGELITALGGLAPDQ